MNSKDKKLREWTINRLIEIREEKRKLELEGSIYQKEMNKKNAK